MTQLAEIRVQLAALRRRRRWVRRGTALASCVAITGGVLMGLFVLDVAFELSILQRIVMGLLSLSLVIWAIWQWVYPWIGIRESEIDMALQVERACGIDSDLVAALQFERPEAVTWGSPALAGQVVRRVADGTSRIDVYRGQRYDVLRQRAGYAGAALAFAAVLGIVYPRHLPVFVERWLFSGRHYPSDTIIEQLSINDREVLSAADRDQRPRRMACAQGQPVTFLVRCTGELPATGRIEIRSERTGESRTTDLYRLAASPQGEKVAQFSAKLPRMIEPFQYTLRLGDAWTETAEVEMIDLPVVDLDVSVVPPEYARGVADAPSSPRHISVLEGSTINLSLRSVNGKRLQRVTILCQSGDEPQAMEFQMDDREGKRWKLADRDSPLTGIRSDLNYEIQVVDTDDLGLEVPLRGFIQLKRDRPPSAVAQVVHRVVLPSARPVVEYRVDDDYGVSTVALLAQVEGPETSPPSGTDVAIEPPPVESPPVESLTAAAPAAPPVTVPKYRLEVPLDSSPLPAAALPYRGQFPLDLAPFQLVKGDRVKVTLEIVDFRGQAAGATFFSEPLWLEVSDEAGVLAAISAADDRTENQLNEVIEQQLGVGGAR